MERPRTDLSLQIEKEGAAHILGKLVERTGRRPSEAVIQLLKEDPKLLDAFFEGAIEVDRQRRGLTKK